MYIHIYLYICYLRNFLFLSLYMSSGIQCCQVVLSGVAKLQMKIQKLRYSKSRHFEDIQFWFWHEVVIWNEMKFQKKGTQVLTCSDIRLSSEEPRLRRLWKTWSFVAMPLCCTFVANKYLFLNCNFGVGLALPKNKKQPFPSRRLSLGV
jgi:hypothetical protein